MKTESDFDEIDPLSVDADDMKELEDDDVEETDVDDIDADPEVIDVDALDEQDASRPRHQRVSQ